MGNRVGVYLLGFFFLLLVPAAVRADEAWWLVAPEQTDLEIRRPEQLGRARIPRIEPPRTVDRFEQKRPAFNLSLDEAIRVALRNSEVIRVLAGNGAASSGSTIYDPAITNTEVDRARSPFDPSLSAGNKFNRREVPFSRFDPAAPSGVRIDGDPTNDYDLNLGVAKSTRTGATASVNVLANPTRVRTADPISLNPQSRSSVDLRLTQPLLQGAGVAANTAPILVARIDTERSYYEMKDSVQRSVQGVIAAYWSLVFARTDVWVRQQQVQQGDEAFQRAEAMRLAGSGHAADVAQARSALADFRASLISAQGNLLQREAALRDIMGLPPYERDEFVPVTPPSTEKLEMVWDELVETAEANRLDLVRLKLILEADQQRLVSAQNRALPGVDATAMYRFNALEGRAPDGTRLATAGGDFTGWQLGIDVNLPLGLRQARAELRRQQLLVARDRANLHEGLHRAAHSLATRYRNLDQFWAEYQALKNASIAARINLQAQTIRFRIGDTIYLNVLQAITDWGNAVSAEAQALVRYNSELANLEVELGTILSSHGIAFFEEGYPSMGPKGRLFSDRCYPRSVVPGENEHRYPVGQQPAENTFDLAEPRGLPRKRP